MFKIAEEDKNKIGVYQWKNLLVNEIYIGSTGNSFRIRFTEHVGACKNGSLACPRLYNAMRKYGIENFEFTILEIADSNITKEELEDLEQKYMDLLNPKYNVRKIASSNLGCKHAKDAKSRRRGKEHHSSKKIIQLTLDDKKIKEFDSISDANKSIGSKNNLSQISECCMGLRQTAQGYKWEFEDKKHKKYNAKKMGHHGNAKKRIFIKNKQLDLKFDSIKTCANFFEVDDTTINYYLRTGFMKSINAKIGRIN